MFLNNDSSCKYYSQISPSINAIDYPNIIHFHARSLNANFKQIESNIHTLNRLFDVITISETLQ